MEKENTQKLFMGLFKPQLLNAIKKSCEKQTGAKELNGCFIYIEENKSTVEVLDAAGATFVFQKKINNIDFFKDMIKKQFANFEKLGNIEIVANFKEKKIKIKYDYYLMNDNNKKTNTINL